ncbi:MAG TPA: sigma-E factor negative regulatory protein [Luteimonas sp.]|nr:sigma-E factor negative regulatory protein [Luteimonas sp.]
MNHSDDMTQTDTRIDKLHDHHRQQLSAMLDGELLPDQARFMLRRLEHDGELAACWERWQVCGDILRGRHEALLPADFSRRVADAIAGQDQAAAVATDEASTRRPRWARWGGGAALAASVAMAALFVGRQAPELVEPEPNQEQMQVVASTSTPDAAARTPSPAPESAPAAPVGAPDTTSTLAAAAVAVAEVPRRAAERRSSNAQQQRAAARNRRTAEAPVRVAAASRAAPAGAVNSEAAANAVASNPVLVADTGVVTAAPAATAADLFPVEPAQSRPWPRAILPGFPAQDAFTASYGGAAPEQHPFHPFEPHVELDLPARGPQPGASGPR